MVRYFPFILEDWRFVIISRVFYEELSRYFLNIGKIPDDLSGKTTNFGGSVQRFPEYLYFSSFSEYGVSAGTP